jgi:hypothetical protein
MKTELEIRNEISSLQSMLTHNENSDDEAEKLRSLMVALHWVLGETSDIFN